MSDQKGKKTGFNPLGLCFGVSIGLCFGTAMGNMGAGICLGMGVGLCFCVALGNLDTKNDKEDKDK
nr:hypothetical protein [Clostridia bacterium]